MGRGLERAWVRTKDSAAWRKTWQASAIRDLRNHRAFEAADLNRRRVLSMLSARRQRDRYNGVRTFCLLVGHTKSGGSLLGALLDAHPDAVLADEVDALAYFSAGFTPHQVFSLLEKGARREAMKGRMTARRLDPYTLAVPGQWQGRTATLRVIGDSKAGIATQRLGADPALIDRLDAQLGGVELRFVHVVRNPFDPISAMMLRGRRTFESAFDRYFANCVILRDLHQQLPKTRIHVVRYEDMVAEPIEQLAAACHFVGLEKSEAHLAAGASIVASRPPERTHVEWDDEKIGRVMGAMGEYPFLRGYAFDHRGAGP